MRPLLEVFKEKKFLSVLSFAPFTLWLLLVLSVLFSYGTTDIVYAITLIIFIVSFFLLSYHSISNHPKSLTIAIIALLVMIITLYFESLENGKTITVLPVTAGFLIAYCGLINSLNLRKR